MIKLLSYNQINPTAWLALVNQSPYTTWFQTPEAYAFYASLPEEMTPFAYGVEREGELKGVVVGYITQEKNYVRQFFTRRAIIIGGPLLADDICEEALTALLNAVKTLTSRLSPFASRLNASTYGESCEQPTAQRSTGEADLQRSDLQAKPIYIETRNFHDYSRWKEVFIQSGFTYQPHLNFHVDTTDLETMQSRIGKHRWKYIRLSMRDGAKIIENPTIDQVRDYYTILQHLYRTKVRTPLFSWQFFEQLYHVQNAHFLLVEVDGAIVGGVTCVCLPGRAVYEWYACGLDECRDDIRPLSVATWGEMQYAAQNGYPLFDFMGAGVPGEPYGVRDFKAEFGGELVEHGRFLCVRKPLLYWIGKMGVKWLKRCRV